MSERLKPVFRRDVIRGARDRWLAQYKSYPDSSPVGWGSHRTAGDIRSRLMALDVETCSHEDVDSALDVSGWGNNDCDVCGANCETLLRIGDEPDYEQRWQDVCADCLDKASAVLAAATRPKEAQHD